MIATLPLLRCPQCHGELELSTERAVCSTGHGYRVEGKTVNFLGATREKFHDQPFDHSAETSGIAFRTDNYLIPWLRRYFGEDISRLRVLEDGAGGGAQIEAYLKHGVDAHGIDPGPRSELWSRTRASGRCHVADGTQLPFADCTFDAVTSSGVLEHVGEPRTVPQMDPCQSAYMREIVRVLRPGGVALVAHPNGANPVDFWHAERGSARLHRPYEKWMPDIYQVRRWVRSSTIAAEVRFLSPHGYLSFERVRRYWYGRLLATGMQRLFAAMEPVPFLARTWINPWLVTEIRRVDGA